MHQSSFNICNNSKCAQHFNFSDAPINLFALVDIISVFTLA